jgi:hypothetical protein
VSSGPEPTPPGGDKADSTAKRLYGRNYDELPDWDQQTVDRYIYCEYDRMMCKVEDCVSGSSILPCTREMIEYSEANPPPSLSMEEIVVTVAIAVVGLALGARVPGPKPVRPTPVPERAPPRGGTCPAFNSFDPDTPVLMADGTTKPIKDVKAGDVVLATDPETGRTEARPVTTLHRNLDHYLTDITIAAADGTTTVLHTTAEHPFWNATQQEWTTASRLSPGELLHTSTGGPARVTAVRTLVRAAAMYNLTIHDIHTYYVIGGNTHVLVHNENGPSGVVARGPNGIEISIYANDHAPHHAHLKGRGFDIRIGQNGKPLDPNVQLNRAQQDFVDSNLSRLRSQLKKKDGRIQQKSSEGSGHGQKDRMLTGLGEALRMLAGHSGIAVGASIEDEHFRWEIYRSAISNTSAHSLLASTLALDPDPILVQSVVLAVLERVETNERQRWIDLVKEERRREYAVVRARELDILDRKAIGLPPSDRDVTRWTDWLQLRLAETDTDDEVLEALALHGRTRRIRHKASEGLRSARRRNS